MSGDFATHGMKHSMTDGYPPARNPGTSEHPDLTNER
eukprot:COSAG02_NODE_28_length_51367_cov_70.053932_26_plen_37_part_00